MDPLDGPRDLTVHAYAVIAGDRPLPEGTYEWKFDDEAEAGPVSTHSERYHTFTTGGLHLVSLTVTLAGLSTSFSCTHDGAAGKDPSHAPVTVWPVVAGTITDSAGQPVPNVPVTADGVATAVTTDAAGRYEVTVPYNWSGTVTPTYSGRQFDPPSLGYSGLKTDKDDGNFVMVGAPETVLLTGRVATSEGIGVNGVTVRGTDLPGSTTTAGDGQFELLLPIGWSGRITPDNPDWVFDPPYADYVDVRSGPTALHFLASPTPNQHNPPIAYDQGVDSDEDVTTVITLTGSDPDGDELQYVVVTLPAHGTLLDAANSHAIALNQLPYTLPFGGQAVAYTNAWGYTGADSFTFRVSDRTFNSPPATVEITIIHGSHPPDAQDQQVTVPLNTATPITLTATDPHGDSLTYSVLTAPGHGTLAGSPPNVTYTPNPGYTGADTFTFTACDGYDTSPPGVVTVTVGAWSPPIGVPMPPFGVLEVHTMYAGQQWNYGSGLEPYRNAGNGPYTHYIDTSHAQSTDTNNTYGTPSKPRKTIPSDLPAGSVVEVHGGPYNYAVGGVVPLGGAGTASKPIFIRGISAAARPQFNRPIDVRGQYVIVENINLRAWSTYNDTGISFRGGVNHAALRHSEVHEGPEATTSAVCVGGSSSSSKATYIVVYHNTVHDNGDWQATYDQDHHGVGVFEYSENIWVVDNEMYHNSGDGMQINAGNYSLRTTLHHVYVGRNLAWENKQTGLWTKFASDVVFSQNTIHSQRPSDSSSGAGCGWQYGPERVWFLFNHIYDCDMGIGSGSISGPGGDGTGMDIYLVGNVIHDIHRTQSGGGGPWKNGGAFSFTDEYARKHVINNTVYDVDAGVLYARGTGGLTLVNNLFSNVTEEDVWLERDEAKATSALHHTLFGQPAAIIWGSSPTYTLAGFRAAYPSQGAGCLETNSPGFANAGAGNFHLQQSSPAVNAGTTESTYSTFQSTYGLNLSVDFDNVARPQGAAFDMGAFERTP